MTETPTIYYGVGFENIKDIEQLGNVLINVKQMYLNNKLIVKSLKGFVIVGLPTTMISDTFVNFVFDLLKEKNIEVDELKKLKVSEMHMFILLLKVSGLRRSVNIDIQDTLVYLKEQEEVISQEISDGNLQLKRQYQQIVYSLYQFGLITQKQCRERIHEVCK
jgi:hypothetical protein